MLPIAYECTGLVLEVLFKGGVPSPKLQFQKVMPFPEDTSVNWIVSGAVPDEVLVVKAAVREWITP